VLAKCPSVAAHPSQYDVNNVCKVLRPKSRVQLIVFLGAIKEILKKEIYQPHK
jgi:hypothetical protein